MITDPLSLSLIAVAPFVALALAVLSEKYPQVKK